MAKTPYISYDGQSEITGLNALKMVCAIMVVLIHVSGYTYRAYLIPFCRIAVPVFFMISGYFLLLPDGTISTTRVRRIIFKILKIAIVTNVLYASFIYLAYHNTNPKFIEYLFFNYKSYLYLIGFGNIFNHALWYLNAYIFALIVIHTMVKLRIDKYLYLFIPLGLIVGTIIYYYSYEHFHVVLHRVQQPNFMGNYLRNFFVSALPYLMIGVAIRRYQSLLGKYAKFLPLALLAALLLTVAHEMAFGQFGEYSSFSDAGITTPILAFCTFMYALEANRPNQLKWLAQEGRRHSLNIYLFHTMVVMSFILAYPTVTMSSTIGNWYPVLIIILTWTMSYGINAALSYLKKIDIYFRLYTAGR